MLRDPISEAKPLGEIFRKNAEIIAIERRYDECMPCKLPEHVADKPFGLESRYSLGLCRNCRFLCDR